MNSMEIRSILFYTVLIGAIVFILQRSFLGADTQSAVMWALMFSSIAFASSWRHVRSQQKKKK